MLSWLGEGWYIYIYRWKNALHKGHLTIPKKSQKLPGVEKLDDMFFDDIHVCWKQKIQKHGDDNSNIVSNDACKQ